MADAPTISFRCPKCDRSLRVAIQHAGKRGKCLACGAVIQIPIDEPARPVVPASSAPTSSPGLIGVTDPACPYCGRQLEKMPGRKKRCPACGNDIFVRTRPQDKARILVRGDQLLEVEEQWAIANGTHDQFLAAERRRQNITAQLRTRFGREPSEHDIQWALLSDDIVTRAREENWGHYRNARFAMAEMLAKEKELLQALEFLLEVCYLDLNGPNNCGGLTDPGLLREFPRFDPEDGFLAPGVVARVHGMMDTLQESPQQVQSRFATIADRLARSLKLPLPPEEAWDKLERQINAT